MFYESSLDQTFNSLDAQREACEAFALSQKHEGWQVLSTMYDDGGISGGTMERPALQRLLADIEAKKVDTVVVYKVDRLTRSLRDFAKIVEVFDQSGVSFVSVTQQFNTTTSMGRLTLNMLLSFAQFEREVTGERIRDKIAASKKKGMWMGGNVPLGYDATDRKLVVNEAEAKTVRHIYRRYAELGSVRLLKEELEHGDIVSKARVDKYGRQAGGKPLTRGALYLMLQNPIYRGRIVHKENSYVGEHKAIIDASLWDKVQQRLDANRVERVNGTRAREPSLLAGLVYDDTGERMIPSHANKKGIRYRYYVSKPLIFGARRLAPHGRRVPASDLEGLVEDRLRKFLANEGEIFGVIENLVTDANDCKDLTVRAADLAARWATLAPAIRRRMLRHLVDRIDLLSETLEIRIIPGRLPALLGDEANLKHTQKTEADEATMTLTVTARLKRAGMETKFLIEGAGGGLRGTPDRSLLRLLGQAHRFRNMVMRGDGKKITELAQEAGVGRPYFSRILRLSFLSPDITTMILRGKQPVELTANKLARVAELPADWREQHIRFSCTD